MSEKTFVDKGEVMDLCQLTESLEGETDFCLFFLEFRDDLLIEEMVFDALISQCECCCDGGYND